MRLLNNELPRYRKISPQPRANHITGQIFGLLHEHQRVTADSYVKFNCRALYPAVARLVASLDENEPAFGPGMSIEAKMKLV